MSDIGLSGSQFEINQETLREFDRALGILQSNKVANKNELANTLLSIMEPIVESMQFRANSSSALDDFNILESLKKRVSANNWNQYTILFQNVIRKIKNKDLVFEHSEIEILNDIGDALNDECNRHFRRLRT